MTRAEVARFFEHTHGKTRKRELTTSSCRLGPRARSLHPIQLSRHGSVFAAASNSGHPGLRPSRSATK